MIVCLCSVTHHFETHSTNQMADFHPISTELLEISRLTPLHLNQLSQEKVSAINSLSNCCIKLVGVILQQATYMISYFFLVFIASFFLFEFDLT